MTDPIEPSNVEIEMKMVAERAAGKALPPNLKALTERHIERVLTLVDTMRSAGVDESLVRHSVREVIDSYEKELVDALTRIAKENE